MQLMSDTNKKLLQTSVVDWNGEFEGQAALKNSIHGTSPSLPLPPTVPVRAAIGSYPVDDARNYTTSNTTVSSPCL